jgi:hypothetical protein
VLHFLVGFLQKLSQNRSLACHCERSEAISLPGIEIASPACARAGFAALLAMTFHVLRQSLIDPVLAREGHGWGPELWGQPLAA